MTMWTGLHWLKVRTNKNWEFLDQLEDIHQYFKEDGVPLLVRPILQVYTNFILRKLN